MLCVKTDNILFLREALMFYKSIVLSNNINGLVNVVEILIRLAAER